MIRAMHRRLALLNICVIGAILCLAAGAALLVTERQLTARESAAFAQQLDSLAQQIRMQKSISITELAKIEAGQRMILSILDNERPIAFKGAWNPVTPRDALIEAATAQAEGGDLRLDRDSMRDGARYIGQRYGGYGERYLVGVVCVRDYRDMQAVVALQDMRAQDAQRISLRWMYAGIVAGALLLLSVFGWFFTGWTLRPIETAHRKQNEFIAAASHEIRTPLSVMQTGIDALKERAPDEERFIAQIQGEANRIAALTGDMLLLTALRLPQKAGAGAEGPVEARGMIREAAHAYEAMARAKGIELRVSLSEAMLPIVCGDASLLARALNALIDNAIEYAPAGGHVELAASHGDDMVCLRVRDDGPGIAPEHRDRIFERFYRLDHSRDSRTHSGLGLSIAREIVQAHGGKLIYHALKPHGSEFVIRLPGMKKQ